MNTSSTAALARSARTVDYGTAIAIVIAFLLIDHAQNFLRMFDAYRDLYRHYPFFVPEGGKSLLQIVACIACAYVIYRKGLLGALEGLGFAGRINVGLAFGAAATLPMFVGLAFMGDISADSFSLATLYRAGLSPLAEEVLYRGFACGLLVAVARCPPAAAIALTAVVFGWGHTDKGGDAATAIGLFLYTATAGAAVAWFYLRWGRNLWVPLFVHVLANSAWELFDVADTALGGWYPFFLQAAMLITGVTLTLCLTSSIARVVDVYD